MTDTPSLWLSAEKNGRTTQESPAQSSGGQRQVSVAPSVQTSIPVGAARVLHSAVLALRGQGILHVRCPKHTWCDSWSSYAVNVLEDHTHGSLRKLCCCTSAAVQSEEVIRLAEITVQAVVKPLLQMANDYTTWPKAVLK